MIKIGLLWHTFFSDNLGVGALSLSHIHQIDKICWQNNIYAEYLIIGTRGGKKYLPTRFESKISFYPARDIILPWRFFKVLKIVRECDILLDIGEGDSFSDIYGLKRFFQICLYKIVCILFKKDYVLAPQTIGPFNNVLARQIAHFLIKKARYVFPRDIQSKEYLDEYFKTDNYVDVTDIAFGLPFTKENKIKRIFKIGLNISGLLYNGGYTGQNQFGLSLNYKEFTDELITGIKHERNVAIHLIPHVIFENFHVDDDYSVSIILKEKFPFLVLPDKFTSPVDVKSYISGMDFVIAARMHASIAAFSSGVPVIPVCYSRKFTGLYRSLDYKWYVDARKLSQKEAIDSIMQGLDNIDIMKEDVEKGNRLASKLLERYFSRLEALLQEKNEKKLC